MRRLLLLLGLLVAMCGCCRKIVPVSIQRVDSVRFEHVANYIERLRVDTVYVEVPAQSAERSTAQKASHLETDYAVSDAQINVDGTLYHFLANKVGRRPFTVNAKDTEKFESRDSIIYRDRMEVVPIKLPLTWWEKFWHRSGQIGWGILLITIIFYISKHMRFWI